MKRTFDGTYTTGREVDTVDFSAIVRALEAARAPDPLATWMRQQDADPDAGWVLVLPESFKARQEQVWTLPRYLIFSPMSRHVWLMNVLAGEVRFVAKGEQ